MQFADCARSRKMVRSFRDKPVAPELIDRVVEIATWAPSAGKTQGWHLVVMRDADTKRFWDITLPEPKRKTFRWKNLLNAPVIALVFADPQAYLDRYGEPDKASTNLGQNLSAWSTPYWTVDASFATMQLLLATHDLGLGALFFGVFNGEAQLREAVNAPEQMQLIGAVAIGWPASVVQTEKGASARRARRKPDEVIRENTF